MISFMFYFMPNAKVRRAQLLARRIFIVRALAWFHFNYALFSPVEFYLRRCVPERISM